jgi:hypothetical protein
MNIDHCYISSFMHSDECLTLDSVLTIELIVLFIRVIVYIGIRRIGLCSIYSSDVLIVYDVSLLNITNLTFI